MSGRWHDYIQPGEPVEIPEPRDEYGLDEAAELRPSIYPPDPEMAEPGEERERGEYELSDADLAEEERKELLEQSFAESAVDDGADVKELEVFQLHGVVDSYVLESLKASLRALSAAGFLIDLNQRPVTARVQSGHVVDRNYSVRGNWHSFPGLS